MEGTSFGQMYSILHNGCYTIAGTSGKIMDSISDMILLTLTQEKTQKSRKALKKKYSLDDLKDLESKLVLITGSKVENRDDVDKFLSVSYKT